MNSVRRELGDASQAEFSMDGAAVLLDGLRTAAEGERDVGRPQTQSQPPQQIVSRSVVYES